MSKRYVVTNKQIIILFFIVVMVIVIYNVFIHNYNGGHMAAEAVVQDLEICSTSDRENVIENNHVEKETREVAVCGNLHSNLKSVPLMVHVYREPDHELVYYDAELTLPPGSFTYEVNFDDTLDEGKYTFDLYLFRNQVAAFDFEAVP